MQARQDNIQTQVQKIGPHLIHANALLQCTNSELLQMIEQEQQANPALEAIELVASSGDCGHCPVGGPPACSHCPYRRDTHSLSNEQDTPPETRTEDEYQFMMGGSDDAREDFSGTADALATRHDPAGDLGSGAAGSDFDPLLLAPAPTSLREELLSHLQARAATAREAVLIEYLVDALDEHGYLRVDFDEAQSVLCMTREEIEEGVATLQACEPPGIGARNLRECLLLQIEHLRDLEEGNFDKLADPMVRDHWDLFAQRRYAQLARKLGVTQERVEGAVSFVQNRLTPYPASQFRQPFVHRPDAQSEAIKPDVVVVRTPTGFRVELPGMEGINLQINSYYQGLYASIRANGRGSATRGPAKRSPLPRELQRHVQEYVERADLLLKNVQRRQWTIQRIATALVEHQQGFLETGKRSFMRPLTRTQLAQQLGMHESTISRALLHKYVQLPSQDVVPFDFFFGGSSTARDAVAEMIASEDRHAPLSDQAITQALVDRGISIARRTVVKYREEMRIPASYLRRQR